MYTALPRPREQGEVLAPLGEKPGVAGVQAQEPLTTGSSDAHGAWVPNASPSQVHAGVGWM